MQASTFIDSVLVCYKMVKTRDDVFFECPDTLVFFKAIFTPISIFPKCVLKQAVDIAMAIPVT